MVKFRAQVILYCAMLVSRFPDNPSVGGGGVLLFIGEEKKRKNQKDAKDAKPSLGFSQEVVAVLPTEVRGVIQARNRLASALVAFEAGIEDDAGAEANGVLMSGIGQSPSFTQRRTSTSTLTRSRLSPTVSRLRTVTATPVVVTTTAATTTSSPSPPTVTTSAAATTTSAAFVPVSTTAAATTPPAATAPPPQR